jgi:hypothetical protein
MPWHIARPSNSGSSLWTGTRLVAKVIRPASPQDSPQNFRSVPSPKTAIFERPRVEKLDDRFDYGDTQLAWRMV